MKFLYVVRLPGTVDIPVEANTWFPQQLIEVNSLYLHSLSVIPIHTKNAWRWFLCIHHQQFDCFTVFPVSRLLPWGYKWVISPSSWQVVYSRVGVISVIHWWLFWTLFLLCPLFCLQFLLKKRKAQSQWNLLVLQHRESLSSIITIPAPLLSLSAMKRKISTILFHRDYFFHELPISLYTTELSGTASQAPRGSWHAGAGCMHWGCVMGQHREGSISLCRAYG